MQMQQASIVLRHMQGAELEQALKQELEREKEPKQIHPRLPSWTERQPAWTLEPTPQEQPQ